MPFTRPRVDEETRVVLIVGDRLARNGTACPDWELPASHHPIRVADDADISGEVERRWLGRFVDGVGKDIVGCSWPLMIVSGGSIGRAITSTR